MVVEIVIVEHPTKKSAEEGGKLEKIVFGPKAFVAKDEQQAVMLAGREIDLNGVDLSRLEVLVRPFAA